MAQKQSVSKNEIHITAFDQLYAWFVDGFRYLLLAKSIYFAVNFYVLWCVIMKFWNKMLRLIYINTGPSCGSTFLVKIESLGKKCYFGMTVFRSADFNNSPIYHDLNLCYSVKFFRLTFCKIN